MPQMMPLYWLMMMIFLTIIILLLLSFTYFFPISSSLNSVKNFPSQKKWSWKW